MVKIGNIELPTFPLLLAPMEDVSDPPFRALCKENGADVVYTEFISSEGTAQGHQFRLVSERQAVLLFQPVQERQAHQKVLRGR